MGNCFNQDLANIAMHPSRQSQTLGKIFNQSLDILRLLDIVQILLFGAWFNFRVDGVSLSSGVRVLIYGRCFNQRMTAGLLPQSFQKLLFGSAFNQSLVNILPEDLKHWIWSMFCPKELKHCTLAMTTSRVAKLRLRKLRSIDSMHCVVQGINSFPILSQLKLCVIL